MKNIRNLIIVVIILIASLVILKLAPNYEKNLPSREISLIINNNDVTERLKKNVYVDEKNIIYLSIEDAKNYFDKYVLFDEENKQIITTSDTKTAILKLDNKTAKINSEETNLYGTIIEKDDTIYLPFSEMSNIYNIEIEYVQDKKIVTIDSVDRKQTKADSSKKQSVKYKTTVISKTVDKLEKGEKVIIVSEKDGWSKVRTKRGIIGYVKTDKLTNYIDVRDDLKIETSDNTKKISLIWDYFSEYAKAPDRSGQTLTGVNVVSPSFFSLKQNGQGQVLENVGQEGEKYISWAKENGYKVWGMVSNNSYKESTHEILNNYSQRENLIKNIVNLAVKYNLDGINLDFENIYQEDKDKYSRLVIELKPQLAEYGKTLSVDVTAPDGSPAWSLCYDRHTIGENADYVVFMAYDQYGISSTKPGTTAGYNWVNNNVAKFLKQEEVAKEKIILGIPLYTRLWQEKADGNAESKVVNLNKVDKTLSEISENINKTWNDDLKQYYFEQAKNNITYKMWIEDIESIKYKLSIMEENDLAGVAFWRKGMETDDVWNLVAEKIK